jgi:hypothetical protein
VSAVTLVEEEAFTRSMGAYRSQLLCVRLY